MNLLEKHLSSQDHKKFKAFSIEALTCFLQTILVETWKRSLYACSDSLNSVITQHIERSIKGKHNLSTEFSFTFDNSTTIDILTYSKPLYKTVQIDRKRPVAAFFRKFSPSKHDKAVAPLPNNYFNRRNKCKSTCKFCYK